MTLPGIEPATFRFVAQHLNHCATAVPLLTVVLGEIQLCSTACVIHKVFFVIKLYNFHCQRTHYASRVFHVSVS